MTATDKTYQPVLTTSVRAAGAIEKFRFVGFDGKQAGAGDKALGVANIEAAEGDVFPVDVLGIVLVEAGAAVNVGDEVEADAQGRAVSLDTGAGNGYALDAASAAGDVIRIVCGIGGTAAGGGD